MAVAVLDHVPPLIRKSLLIDQSFRKEHFITTETTVVFGKNGVSIKRSKIYSAIRVILSGGGHSEVNDSEDKTWKLMDGACDGELPKLALTSDNQRIILPDFSVLSDDNATRISSLNESASRVNLPFSAQKEWRNVLEKRELEDDEVDAFFSDLHDTPIHVARTIRSEITVAESSVSSLVPNSKRYFNRLVGAYDGSESIRDYAVGAGREVFRQLTEWRPYEGFLFSLLLSSHSSLTAEINIDELDQDELEKAYKFLVNHGDMLSRLGAVEVGLRILPKIPELELYLLQLILLIRDDVVEDEASNFNLFSALFILVDGELARTHLFAEDPPFYRRLASLAQAALIQRQLVQFDINYKRFYDWAVSNCGEHYYMQTLADMRVEPRWNPDLVTASFMQADFIGRILFAGDFCNANIGEGELRKIVLGSGEQSLTKLYEFPRPFFPGPLEGDEDYPNTLPDNVAHTIEKQLCSEEIDATSYLLLTNFAMIYRITSSQAELALKAIRLGNFRITNLANKSQLVSILNGLASVAAISRNIALADALQTLVRRYRIDPEYGFSIEEAMRICLVASASRKDLLEWRQFAGEWLTELAFFKLEGDEGKVFHSHLLVLLDLVPELWVSSARADAALQSLHFS
ncbi:MAG: hypothetical protein KME41_17825 [Candidatus Thiodiazotropha sp. (ex Lucina pensylvanica)]|nr:hypothetical protein [Candidatus Thiodiazotropha sp. (ex Lucina pensylvanica)]